MNDIIFINPPNLMEPILDASFPNLGVLYMESLLIEKGFSVSILNLFNSKTWLDVECQVKQLCSTVIAIPCYTEQRKSVLRLAEICKSIHPSSFILLGGPHATFLEEKIYENYPCIDLIICGEAENKILELFKIMKITSKESTKELVLRYKNISNMAKNSLSSPIIKLDSLPFPNFKNSYFSDYTNTPRLEVHFRSDESFTHQKIAPIITSRGCTSTCGFCCSSSFWGHKYRTRSTQNVIEEIEHWIDFHNIRFYDFLDDNFTHDAERVKEICRMIISRKLDIRWWCSGRVSSLDEEMYDLMKRAGCFLISFGMESGSPSILEKIGKNITPEIITEAAKIVKRKGLAFRTTVTIGNIGESDKSIEQTIELLKKIMPNQIGLFLVELFPGTPLYSYAKKCGFVNDDYWFEKDSAPYVFNEIEHPLSQLLAYRDRIVDAIYNDVISIDEDINYDMNIILGNN